MKSWNKAMVFGVIIAIIIMSGGVYMASKGLIFGNGKQQEKEADSPESTDEKVQEEPGEERENEPDESEDTSTSEEAGSDITFLIMGLDDGGRTDTLMLSKYFEETGEVSILSIPRDTRTTIPGYGLDKINHAHVFGGPELTVESVNGLLDMNVDYYISVDYDMVEEIVDTLGGVEVYLPEPVNGFEEGLNTINGDDVMAYLRHRKSYYNQDLGRIQVQQEFLKALIKKMGETRNIVKISSMIKSGMDNVETNIPLGTTLRYLLKLKDLDTENVEVKTLPGVPAMIGGISYIVVDESQIPDLVDEMFLKEDSQE